MRTLSAIGVCCISWSVALLIGGGVMARAGLPARAGIGGKLDTLSTAPAPPRPVTKPRLVVLPWLVIDRTTNKAYTGIQPSSSPAADEAMRLSRSGMAALDAVLHRHGGLGEMVPTSDWQPFWENAEAEEWLRQGPGCAACTPAGDLLRYDRAKLQSLGRAARADYLFLGITVVPLTEAPGRPRADACCRESLALERDAFLARSSVLLVRVRDGETVWQRDARRLDRDVLRRSSRPMYPPPQEPRAPMDIPGAVPDMARPPETPVWIIYSPEERREMGVDDTAHMLGRAFLRVHNEVMQ